MARGKLLPEHTDKQAKKRIEEAGLDWEQYVEQRSYVERCQEAIRVGFTNGNTRVVAREKYAIWLAMTPEERKACGIPTQKAFAAAYGTSEGVLVKWKADPDFVQRYARHYGAQATLIEDLGEVLQAHKDILLGKNPNAKPSAPLFREYYDRVFAPVAEDADGGGKNSRYNISQGAEALAALFHRDLAADPALRRFYDWLADPDADRLPMWEEARPRLEDALLEALKNIYQSGQRRKKDPDEKKERERVEHNTGRPLLKPRFYEEPDGSLHDNDDEPREDSEW